MKPRARCPRCRSTTLLIVESSEAYTTFEQKDGVIDPDGNHTHGGITGVFCKCQSCTHVWKPRGAMQVTDFVGYPGGE